MRIVVHNHFHDAQEDPPYVRRRQSEYLGREAVAKAQEKRRLEQALWAKKNMPNSLTEEDKALLRKYGKL